MKFSAAISTLILALPLLAEAIPSDVDARALSRQRGNQRAGGNANAGKASTAGKGAAAAGKGAAAAKGAAAGKGAAASAAAAAAAAKKGGAAAGGIKGGATAASQSAAAGKAAATTAAAAAAATTTAAAANGQAQGSASVSDPQNSLQLDPSQVMQNLASDGQAVAEAGQVPSATSKNNFINYCLTRPDLVLTDGEQVLDGSCNPTPMGVIIAKAKMPAGKFQFPQNNAVIPANQAFTIKLAVKNMNTGHFVNPQTNYYAAPAATDGNGLIISHSHVTVQQIPSLDSTDIPDPTVFQFFKGFNAQDVNGVLSADVTAGLAAGVYRMCSIHSAANHQPVLAAVAQHGNFDDCSYFTCSAGGAGANAGGAAAGAGAAASTSAAAAATGQAGGAAAASSTAPAATGAAAAGSGKATGAGAGAAKGGAAGGAGAAKGGAGAAKGGAGAAKGGAGAAKGGAGAAKGGAGAAKGGAGAAKGGAGRGRGGRGRGRGRWARDLTARED